MQGGRHAGVVFFRQRDRQFFGRLLGGGRGRLVHFGPHFNFREPFGCGGGVGGGGGGGGVGGGGGGVGGGGGESLHCFSLSGGG